MRVVLFNHTSGRVEPFKPAAAPQIDFLWTRPQGHDLASLGRARESFLVGTLMDAFVHLGFTFNQNVLVANEKVDLYFGGDPLVPPPGHWLRVENRAGAGGLTVDELDGKGFDRAAFRLFCLQTHYRKPLAFRWDSLGSARSDLDRLRSIARGLVERFGSVEANPKGTAGYKKRFRDALSRDLDLPEALCVLWDGLRPGALSPGSQLGLLHEADSVLGLDFFAS